MEAVAAENATDLQAFGLAPPARTVTIGLAGRRDAHPRGRQQRRRKGGTTSTSRAARWWPSSRAPWPATWPRGWASCGPSASSRSRPTRSRGSTWRREGRSASTPARRPRTSRATDVHKWKRTAPDAKDLDTNKVQDALFAVGGLEVLEFIDAPKPLPTYGLDAPALRVTLRHAGGQAAGLVRGGDEGRRLLRAGGKATTP